MNLDPVIIDKNSHPSSEQLKGVLGESYECLDDLKAFLTEKLVNTRKYMEGRGILIEVHDDSEMETLKKLLEYKIGK